MKKILCFSMIVCSLFIISCDSGGSSGSGGSAPLSGGCTLEDAEGTWEMQSGILTLGSGCVETNECEDNPDIGNSQTCEATDCGGSPCEWYDEVNIAGTYPFTCGDSSEEDCDDLIIYSDGYFEQYEQGYPEYSDGGTWECSADGTEATITYTSETPDVVNVYISGNSMTLSGSGSEGSCTLTLSSTYLRTGDAPGPE